MSKKIKILHVIGSLKIGGAENIAMNFIRKIDRNKFQCDYLVFGNDKGEYEEEAISLGANVIHINSPKNNYLKYIIDIKDILKKGRYDVIHSHMLLNNGLILKIAKYVGIKKRISHSHSTNSGRKENLVTSIYSNIMKKMILKNSTDFIACGKDAGEYLYGIKKFKQDGITINNGIDTEKYRYNENIREHIRKKLNLENNIVVGHIGRFVDTKNHDFLLDVFHEFNKKYENSRLLLIGDGELRGQIESKIQKLNLEGKVIITGMITDVYNVQQAIDIIVFPSKYEGFPVSIIEAQASGIPCVISSSVTDQVKIIDNIKFININEPLDIWVDNISSFIDIKRKDTSKELILNGFDINSSIKIMEKIYEY